VTDCAASPQVAILELVDFAELVDFTELAELVEKGLNSWGKKGQTPGKERVSAPWTNHHL